MNLAYALVAPEQGPVFVRPLENRAFQVANVREPRCPQTLRHFSGSIANRAISHDRRLFRQTCANAFRGRGRLDATPTREMADIPFVLGPNIEKHWRGPAFVRQPVSQLAGGDPIHVRELVPERFLEQKPINAPHPEQRQHGHYQPGNQQAKARVRETRSARWAYDFHGSITIPFSALALHE